MLKHKANFPNPACLILFANETRNEHPQIGVCSLYYPVFGYGWRNMSAAPAHCLIYPLIPTTGPSLVKLARGKAGSGKCSTLRDLIATTMRP